MALNNLDKDYENRTEKREEEQKLKEGKELSNEQVRVLDQRVTKAIDEGDLCYADKALLFARMQQLTDREKDQAPSLLEQYIAGKKKHREAYEKKLLKASEDGVLTKREAQVLIQEYRESNGKERKKMDQKEWQKLLEQREAEKKSFTKILEDSPHFSSNGSLTTEAQELLEKHQTLPEKERLKDKRKLLARIAVLDRSSEMCKEHYTTARKYFEHGEYDVALMLMKRNMRISKRYQESAMLQEYAEWADADMKNLLYEKEKVDELRELREDRDDCLRAGDKENALQISSELVEATTRFHQTTYSGKKEQELPRKEEWITPFMRQMKKEAEETDAALIKIYQQLEEEEEDEQEQKNQEEETIDYELSRDEVAQVKIKAAEDTLEDDPLEKDLETEEEEEKIIDYDDFQDTPYEEREQQILHIDDEIDEENAEDILRSDAKLRLVEEDDASSGRVEKELSERLLEREYELIFKLQKEGKISAETAQEERARILKLQSSDRLGEKVLDIADKKENIVNVSRREASAEGIQDALQQVREKDQSPKSLSEQRVDAQERKKDMLRRLAA